jgi:hypothetical protein
MFPTIMTAWAFFTIPTLSAGRLVLTFVVGSVFVPLMLALVPLAWRRTYAKSPLLRDPLVGWISQDRLVVEGATGRTDLTLDRVIRVREGKGAILLYQGPGLFNVIAREFFETDADWDTARRLTASASAGNSRAIS